MLLIQLERESVMIIVIILLLQIYKSFGVFYSFLLFIQAEDMAKTKINRNHNQFPTIRTSYCEVVSVYSSLPTFNYSYIYVPACKYT